LSDPAGELREALEPWLRGDSGIIAAFQSRPVKIFTTLPPVNEAPPYIFIAGIDVVDALADCFDGAEIDLQVDVWSRTSPPGFTEAERISPAVKAAISALEDGAESPAFALANFRVVSSQPISTTYLTDPSDGETVHAVIKATLSIDPID
jgi:hypothetical protein